MRYFGVAGVVALIAVVACAEQNNPLPGPPDETGDGGSSDGNTGGKANGGSGGSVISKAGTAAGGKPSSGGTDNEGGANENVVTGGTGGAGGTASGGAGGKAGSGGGGAGGSGGKASGGAGGSAGSGGKGGAGGTGGTGGAGCTPTTNGPIGGLSARYDSEIDGATGTGIGSKLIIANQGPSTLNLADLKLRYYLTNEVQATLNKTINWAWYRPNAGGNQVDKKSKVMFNVVPMTCKTANADAYLEFTFTADAGLLEVGYQIYFSWTANNSASQNFTQTNDYSFDTAAVEGTDDTKVVVIQNSGTRVWGTEP